MRFFLTDRFRPPLALVIGDYVRGHLIQGHVTERPEQVICQAEVTFVCHGFLVSGGVFTKIAVEHFSHGLLCPYGFLEVPPFGNLALSLSVDF
jgi:hypothetical protein